MLKDAAGIAGEVLKKVKPPGHDADPETVVTWRWFMALGVVINSTALTAHILLACGLTPLYGGFAHADEVRNNTVEILEQRMWDMKTRQCSASTSEGRQLYSSRLTELQGKYYEIKKRYYQLPECKDIQ